MIVPPGAKAILGKCMLLPFEKILTSDPSETRNIFSAQSMQLEYVGSVTLTPATTYCPSGVNATEFVFIDEGAFVFRTRTSDPSETRRRWTPRLSPSAMSWPSGENATAFVLTLYPWSGSKLLTFATRVISGT